MIIGFVKKQQFSKKQPLIVSNSINYLEAKFVFQTSDWSELVKFAHFKSGDSVYDFLLDGDTIPKEAQLNLYAGNWEVYIHGDRYIVDDDGNEKIVERITTNTQTVQVVKYEQNGNVLPEVGVSVAEQIAAVADNAKKIATSVRNEADAGAFDGKDGYTPVKGIDYFDGNDGVSVTHEWEGTVLKVTSASGTTSADLKGETGPKGEKGDTGPRGESGVIDVSGAAPGQTIKIKSVDKNGNPIEWEAVDFPEAEQSDWNAAEGEKGHILNRTHWSGLEFVEYVPEQTLTFAADDNNGIVTGWYRYREIDYDAKFRVTWDGVPYELYGSKSGDRVNLGNAALSGGTPDTGEPFLITINKENAIAYVYAANKVDGVEVTHTYRLEMKTLVWHKLDPNYLPDGPINETQDWKAEEGEAGHILNRSHWIEFGDEEIEVIPEMAVELKEQPAGGLAGFVSGAEFISGDKYFVYWNGKRYKCVGEAHGKDVNGNPAVYIGNYNKLTDKGDTGEPFALTNLMKGEIVAVHPLDGTTELTLKVTAANKIYHKLPEKFLPDGVPYVEKIQAKGLPETTFELTEQDGLMATYSPDIVDVSVGGLFTVTYNDVEYECEAVAADGAAALGNVDLMEGSGDTGEPFIIMALEEQVAADMGFALMIIALDGSASVTLKIEGYNKIYHKLDAECLPDNARDVVIVKCEYDDNGVLRANLTGLEISKELSFFNRAVFLKHQARIIPAVMSGNNVTTFSHIYYTGTQLWYYNYIVAADGTVEYSNGVIELT